MKKKIVAIILTHNSEHIIKKTIKSAQKVTKNVVIVDSYSNDNTLKIVKLLNCKIIKKKFINYSNQRNFIIRKYNKLCDWQLHLDADEILTQKLIKSINVILASEEKKHVYLIKRSVIFMKKKLFFGGSSNWHLRLFPSKTTLVENTTYDQHFVSSKSKQYLSGDLNDFISSNISKWIISHNNYSSSIAKVKYKNIKKTVNANFFGNNIERLRFFKKMYLKFPSSFLKPIILFIYKYFFLLGFLDGKVGFYYCFFNSLWFRTLIEAKKYENKL